ncbi:unnamed protein product [Rotaria magnacalcarata]|uniref:Uncharacterized protein n=1 Tax=Rotaria magnacalcarata TaxID=392030 RepID=A0A815F688_9BILA|nr:unnamed protein product [Rotaria magnacalcarata]
MDRFNHFEYLENDCKSIDNYNKGKISSLDAALEPVLHDINNLGHYLERAKHDRHFPSEHGLTEDESAAVYLFTDDWVEKSLHPVLNKALQSQKKETLKPWRGFLRLLHAAFNKLPTVNQTIWRGLPIDVVAKLEENQELVLSCITSCSLSPDIMVHFLSEKSVLCSIKPLNSKDIQRYSFKTAYKEVVLLPGTRLRVKSKKSKNKNNEPKIIFEEISQVIYDEEIDHGSKEGLDKSQYSNLQNLESDHRIIKSVTSENEMNDEVVSTQNKSKKNETKAVITFSNGDRYMFRHRDGKRQDGGTYHSLYGEKLKGESAEDKANGEGILTFTGGNHFIGTFKRGKRHGHGILYEKNETIDAGEWMDDELTNQDLKIVSNGYAHRWKNGQYRYYDDKNGNKYIGNIIDGKAHGLGIRIWSDNSRYEGNFKEDKKHGFGIYYYTERDIYKGKWNNDEMNGEGTLMWNSGTLYQGKFSKGKRHGEGILKFSDGSIEKGQWEMDRYISR